MHQRTANYTVNTTPDEVVVDSSSSTKIGVSNEATPLLNGAADNDAVAGGKVYSKAGTSGFSKALFLLVNSVLGSGVLAVSFACRMSGIIPFALLLIGAGFLAFFTISLLIDCCILINTTSYEDIGYASFGFGGRFIASLSIWIQNMSQICSYMVIIGDLLPSVLTLLFDLNHDSIWSNRTFLLCLVTGVVVFPMAVLKRISFLAYTSLFSIACSLGFTVVVILEQPKVPCPLPHFPMPHGENPSSICEIKMSNLGYGTFFAIPTIIFAFMCHPTALPIYTELRDRSISMMKKVVISAMFICVSIYLVDGLFGYLTFRNAVPGDLLKMYTLLYGDGDSVVIVLVTQIVIAVSVCFVIPLIHYSTRRTVDLTLFGAREFSWLRHVMIAVFLIGTALTVAILVKDLDIILAAGGATGGWFVYAILPTVFYLRLSKRLGPEYSKLSFGLKTKRFVSYIVFVLSFCFALVNMVEVALNIIKGE